MLRATNFSRICLTGGIRSPCNTLAPPPPSQQQPQLQFTRSLFKISFNKKPKVAVIHLTGLIQANMGRQGGKNLNLESVRKQVEAAFKLKDLKEVCLVINSPGGSPVQSELIANLIKHKSEKKGVGVTSFVEDVAASGGYWLACIGDEIYTAESSIVGSIGVIGSSFGFENVLKKLDIERRVRRVGIHKDINDPFVPETEEKKAIIDRNMQKIYVNFQNYVKKCRGSRLCEETDLFTGEYWIGEDAVNLGLVDGIKSLQDYLYEKYEDKVTVKRFVQKRSPFEAFGAQYRSDLSIDSFLDDLNYEKYRFR